MAIEVRIPKEIMEYQEKIMFGLSIRQLLSFAAALVIGVTTYLITAKVWGEDLAGYIVIFEVMPIFAIGFIQKNGFPFEKYMGLMIRHMFGYRRRRYQTSLLLDEMKPINESKDKTWRRTNASIGKEPAARKGRRECADGEITAKSRERARKTAIREIATARKDYRAAQRTAKTAERKSGSTKDFSANNPIPEDV